MKLKRFFLLVLLSLPFVIKAQQDSLYIALGNYFPGLPFAKDVPAIKAVLRDTAAFQLRDTTYQVYAEYKHYNAVPDAVLAGVFMPARDYVAGSNRVMLRVDFTTEAEAMKLFRTLKATFSRLYPDPEAGAVKGSVTSANVAIFNGADGNRVVEMTMLRPFGSHATYAVTISIWK